MRVIGPMVKGALLAVLVGVTVRTTGINWDSVLAIGTEMIVIFGAVGAAVRSSFRRQIREAVDSAVKKEISPVIDKINARLDLHDTKLARLEGLEEGQRLAIAQIQAGRNEG